MNGSFFFWAEVEDEKITHRKKKTRECFIRMTCVADTIEWIYTLSVLCGYFKIPEYFSLAFSQFISMFLRNYFVWSYFEPDSTSWSWALVDTLLFAFLVLPPTLTSNRSQQGNKLVTVVCEFIHIGWRYITSSNLLFSCFWKTWKRLGRKKE